MTDLLSQRLKTIGVPPCPYQPAFDRICVYQYPEEMARRETFAEGGVVLKPENVRARDEKVSPRGLLVAAGIEAMDYLRSNCIALGHIVWTARFSPWAHVIERRETGDVTMMFMRAGDIVGSEDVLRLIREGKVAIEVGPDGKHVYKVLDEAVPRFDLPNTTD